MANRGTSVDGGWKLVFFGLCVFSGSFGVRSIVLCKCSGKYIDIYFILEITFTTACRFASGSCVSLHSAQGWLKLKHTKSGRLVLLCCSGEIVQSNKY